MILRPGWTRRRGFLFLLIKANLNTLLWLNLVAKTIKINTLKNVLSVGVFMCLNHTQILRMNWITRKLLESHAKYLNHTQILRMNELKSCSNICLFLISHFSDPWFLIPNSQQSRNCFLLQQSSPALVSLVEKEFEFITLQNVECKTAVKINNLPKSMVFISSIFSFGTHSNWRLVNYSTLLSHWVIVLYVCTVSSFSLTFL